MVTRIRYLPGYSPVRVFLKKITPGPLTQFFCVIVLGTVVMMFVMMNDFFWLGGVVALATAFTGTWILLRSFLFFDGSGDEPDPFYMLNRNSHCHQKKVQN